MRRNVSAAMRFLMAVLALWIRRAVICLVEGILLRFVVGLVG